MYYLCMYHMYAYTYDACMLMCRMYAYTYDACMLMYRIYAYTYDACMFMYRLGPRKASQCNLPLPFLNTNEKYVFLFVAQHIKSELFTGPGAGPNTKTEPFPVPSGYLSTCHYVNERMLDECM